MALPLAQAQIDQTNQWTSALTEEEARLCSENWGRIASVAVEVLSPEEYVRDEKKPIGDGTSAQVWNLKGRKDLVLKQSRDPEKNNYFTEEYQMLRALQGHLDLFPKVVGVLDSPKSGRRGIVMERLPKEAFGQQLGFVELRGFARKGLEALSILKKEGMIHGDMSSTNLTWPFRLFDFGLSFVTPHERLKDSDLIQAGAYRSPEVYLLFEKYTCAADMWSLAVVLFELCTKQFLFGCLSGDPECLEMFLERTIRYLGPIPRSVTRRCKSEWLSCYVSSKGVFRKPQKAPVFPRDPIQLIDVLTDQNAKLTEAVFFLSLEMRISLFSKFKEAEAKSFADFLRYLLVWDPHKRPTPEEALQHPFLQDASSASVESKEN